MLSCRALLQASSHKLSGRSLALGINLASGGGLYRHLCHLAPYIKGPPGTIYSAVVGTCKVLDN